MSSQCHLSIASSLIADDKRKDFYALGDHNIAARQRYCVVQPASQISSMAFHKELEIKVVLVYYIECNTTYKF